MKQEPNAPLGAASGYPLLAGDVVWHRPSGEEWMLACDEESGEVMPCGWPLCIAKASDCELRGRIAGDRELTLYRLATECGDDVRAKVARRQLAENDVAERRAQQKGNE